MIKIHFPVNSENEVVDGAVLRVGEVNVHVLTRNPPDFCGETLEIDWSTNALINHDLPIFVQESRLPFFNSMLGSEAN